MLLPGASPCAAPLAQLFVPPASIMGDCLQGPPARQDRAASFHATKHRRCTAHLLLGRSLLAQSLSHCPRALCDLKLLLSVPGPAFGLPESERPAALPAQYPVPSHLALLRRASILAWVLRLVPSARTQERGYRLGLFVRLGCPAHLHQLRPCEAAGGLGYFLLGWV